MEDEIPWVLFRNRHHAGATAVGMWEVVAIGSPDHIYNVWLRYQSARLLGEGFRFGRKGASVRDSYDLEEFVALANPHGMWTRHVADADPANPED